MTLPFARAKYYTVVAQEDASLQSGHEVVADLSCGNFMYLAYFLCCGTRKLEPRDYAMDAEQGIQKQTFGDVDKKSAHEHNIKNGKLIDVDIHQIDRLDTLFSMRKMINGKKTVSQLQEKLEELRI